MSPERWEKVKDLFVEVEACSAAERGSYLDAHCASDPELRAEVERLLANDPSVALIDRSPVPHGLLRSASGTAGTIAAGMLLAGRFRIVRMLGSGGMGEVYQAEDTRLDQMVAIKTIRTEFAADENAVARFRREISLARQVTHPGICRVFDFFSIPAEIPGQPLDFLTMEFIEGETLSALLKREGPLSFEAAFPIIRQVASALDAAHAARVMHRDLKSSNVILGKDAGGELRAVVTDFGVARSTAGGDTIATGSGFAAGTPAYMAPEQLEGKELTAAADLYSLGVLMYEMATGTTPHAADSPLQITARRVKEAPTPPSQLRPVPVVWERAILKCLEMDPRARFSSGAELVAALESGKAVRGPRVWRMPRTRWVGAAASVAALVVLWWVGRDWVPAKAVNEQAARFYRDGVIAMSDGAYHKASVLLGMAVQAEPTFAVAHCRLAEAYQELDQRDRAREELLKALDGLAWARHERLLREATKHYLTGNWDKAAEALRARVGSVRAGEKTGAMLDLARLYDRAGRATEAIETYRAVLGRDDTQPAAAVGLAGLLHASGKRDEVEKLLDQAERMYGVTQNTEGLGMLHLTRGTFAVNTDQCVEEAKKAEALGRQIGSPSLEIQAKLLQARRIDYQGKGEEARKLAEDAVALAEEKGLGALAARALADLGMVPFSQRKYEEAEALFWRAVALAQRYGAKRTEALAKVNLVSLAAYQSDEKKLLRGRELGDEISAFFEATGDNSRYIQARRYYLNTLRGKDRSVKAKSGLQLLLARCTNEADTAAVRTDLGKLAMTSGNYEEARQLFEQSVAYFRKTGDQQLEQNYVMHHARALRSLGRLQEAYDELRQMEEQGLAGPAVRGVLDVELAKLEFHFLKFDSSLRRIERQAEDARKAGQLQLLRGMRLDLCVKYSEAGRYKDALAICPPLLAEFRGQQLQLANAHEALAFAHSAAGRHGVALQHGEEAARLASESKSMSEITWAQMVLTLTMHAAGNRGWMA
ncbi:MAG: protein kinase, partial [Bryobacterales bacterium]|nr:protein kinase [Bryobacterales bacterium]